MAEEKAATEEPTETQVVAFPVAESQPQLQPKEDTRVIWDIFALIVGIILIACLPWEAISAFIHHLFSR